MCCQEPVNLLVYQMMRAISAEDGDCVLANLLELQNEAVMVHAKNPGVETVAESVERIDSQLQGGRGIRWMKMAGAQSAMIVPAVWPQLLKRARSTRQPVISFAVAEGTLV